MHDRPLQWDTWIRGPALVTCHVHVVVHRRVSGHFTEKPSVAFRMARSVTIRFLSSYSDPLGMDQRRISHMPKTEDSSACQPSEKPWHALGSAERMCCRGAVELAWPLLKPLMGAHPRTLKLISENLYPSTPIRIDACPELIFGHLSRGFSLDCSSWPSIPDRCWQMPRSKHLGSVGASCLLPRL